MLKLYVVVYAKFSHKEDGQANYNQQYRAFEWHRTSDVVAYDVEHTFQPEYHGRLIRIHWASVGLSDPWNTIIHLFCMSS